MNKSQYNQPKIYDSNICCQCGWITGRYGDEEENYAGKHLVRRKKCPRVGLPYSVNLEHNCSIFFMGTAFQYTMNVVLGSVQNPVHAWNNVHSLLNTCVKFMKFLHNGSDPDIFLPVSITINSIYKDFLKSKEHGHALLNFSLLEQTEDFYSNLLYAFKQNNEIELFVDRIMEKENSKGQMTPKDVKKQRDIYKTDATLNDIGKKEAGNEITVMVNEGKALRIDNYPNDDILLLTEKDMGELMKNTSWNHIAGLFKIHPKYLQYFNFFIILTLNPDGTFSDATRKIAFSLLQLQDIKKVQERELKTGKIGDFILPNEIEKIKYDAKRHIPKGNGVVFDKIDF